MEKLHGADPVVRAMERENRELREELRKRVEQQSIMEQIVGNVSSLLDGASEAMCIFDKEGYFLHMNNACRRMMGMIDNQHPTSMSIFDAYLPRDRDRVVREFFTKKVTNKWNGMVTFFNKHTGYESTVMQTIEALSMGKHSTETAFFKSFFTPQSQEVHEKIRMFSDMITHMPHGVGMWRLERGHTTPAVLRLACANKIANQYVGVPLLPGSLIHEVIPGGPGIEVHRFLEDVVRTQRVISLDSFRIGAHSFSVTAYPLYPDFVVVIMDPPKSVSSPSSPTPSAPVIKEPTDLSAFVSASGLAVAACDATHVVHANDNMTSMLSVPPSYLKGRDFLSVLDTRTRSSSRSSIDQFRRAMRDRVVHHVEVELENYAWKMSCHPMGEGGRHLLVIAYRTRNLAPQVQAHSQRPMFPILPSSFASSSSSSPFSEPSKTFTDSVYKDTIDFIPCGIVILKAEDIDVRSQFKVISVNHAAKGLSIAKGLSPGHRFDDSTSPFDPSFMRSMHMATKSHEGRIAVAGEKQTARIVPLHDASHIAIMFEEVGLFDIPHIFDSPRNGSSSSTSKRAISDLVDAVDRSYHTLPNSHSSQPSKYMRKQENINTPSDVFLPFSNKSTSLPILPPLQPQSFSSSSYNQQPLSARSDKMDKIVQNCTMAIVCIDPSGGITMANKSFGQMLGYSESDLSFPPSPPNLQIPSSNHLQIVDVVHQDDVSEARGAVRQIVCGEITNLDLPLRFIHKVTRNIVWGVASFMAIEKGVVLQIQQPTKLKNFPEVLLSDKDVLRTAFSEMVVGTAVLNVEKTPKIVSSNGGFCAIMAGKENDLAGRALVDLLHAGDRDAVISVALDAAHAQNASDAVRAHRSQLLSVRTQPLSGPARYGALSLSAVLDSNSRPFLLIAQLQLVDKPFSS